MFFDFFEDDECKGKLDHCHIVLHFLLPADEDAPEAVHPAVGAFYHPPPCGLSGVPVRQGIFSAMANVRGIAILTNKGICDFVIIPLVHAKVLLLFRCRDGTKSDGALQGAADELHVMHVCSGYGEGQRNPVGVCENASLGSLFSPCL